MLWSPDAARVSASQVADFASYLISKGEDDWGGDFHQLWQWSVQHPTRFWDHLWDWHGIIGDKGAVILEAPDEMRGGSFTPKGASIMPKIS